MPNRVAMIIGALVALSPCLACDGDKAPSMAEALAKSDKAEADRKAAEEKKKAAVKVQPGLADDPSKVEHPWTVDKVRSGLPMGTVIKYAVSGLNAKGKDVTDAYRAEVKGNNENDVRIVQTLLSAADTPQATQVATLPWDRVSPFFAVEKATTEITGREKITTAAGEFDCIKADLKGFFGAHKSVWMPIGKPGIYAKVIDHGNANEEGDQTEMVYELSELTMPAK